MPALIEIVKQGNESVQHRRIKFLFGLISLQTWDTKESDSFIGLYLFWKMLRLVLVKEHRRGIHLKIGLALWKFELILEGVFWDEF